MAKTSFREHIRFKQLGLYYDNPTLFTISQWQFNKSQPNTLYMIYRILVSAFTLVVWSIRVSGMEDATHLTMWGYTIVTLNALLAFVLQFASMLFIRISHKPNKMQNVLKLYPLYWLINSIATSVGFLISFLYWSFVFNDQVLDVMNFLVHGGNSILLMIDLWIVANPVRILHFVYPLVFAVMYNIFSIIYHFYDVNRGGCGYIYRILDWNHPVKTFLISIGIGIVVISFHLLTFGIYKLKLSIHNTTMLAKSRRLAEEEVENKQNLNKAALI
ncbi:hypothetical protein NQ318_003989 [Aromia moschata]|uniref:Protein rolling stone n=1 Tax=Aromia moschata TaxID=1265417 RepID=A0AAV8Z8R6_9CUCU|nr:hypothetical protein NQ318_003989 [Aromia moschata]